AAHAADDTLWEKYMATGAESYDAGRYAEAERVWQAALKEAEAFGPEDPRVAASLSNLGELHRRQGKTTDAEGEFRRALALVEKPRGPDDPQVARVLNNLGALLATQGKLADAEALFRRALTIREKAAEPNDLDIAASLDNLAM